MLIALACLALQVSTPVIVDTDAGTDDLMAIAFLLAREDVSIEAVTLAHGLAHVERGAENVLRLLALAGRGDIPVYKGSEESMQKTAEFPAEWRRVSDELPGVTLPASRRRPKTQPAAEFLAARLKDASRPVAVIATGALTNLAQAFQREWSAAHNIRRLVIMGGAIRVPGNLGDGGFYKTDNKTAEWNIFIDPLAARRVFGSGATIDVVPLDATSKVPIDIAFLNQIKAGAKGPLSRFVAQILESERELIQAGIYQAWDPLAAVALVDPGVARWTTMTLDITANGTTVTAGKKGGNTRVALDADAAHFKRVFLGALEGR